MTTWPRAVLFDLDGTLIDSASDLRNAVNELLARSGLEPLSLEQVRLMIGDGARLLVQRAFAAAGRTPSPAELDTQYAVMLGEVYGRHLTGETTLLPGALDVLAKLRSQGRKLAVVTNKPERFTGAVLDHFGLSAFLDTFVGGDAGVEKKPAPDMLLQALNRLGVAPADALMIGDGPADMEAADRAGVASMLLAGGYGQGTMLPARYTITSLDAILGALSIA